MFSNIPVLSISEILAIENQCMESGTSAKTLMENAGKALSLYIKENEPIQDVYFFIGKGNNGGDGLCLARHLALSGYHCFVYLLFPKEQMSSLAIEMLELLPEKGITIIENFKVDKLAISYQSLIIDAIFGIGFKGKIENFLLEIIHYINKSHCKVFAIDIPSGLNSDTGEVETIAIKANVTLAIEFGKPGFYIGKGFEYCGKIVPISIGLDKYFQESLCKIFQLTFPLICSMLPEIKRTRHKYERGYVVCVAGSKDMPGASILASMSALRAGAGICTLFYPQNAESFLGSAAPEIIKKAISDKSGNSIFEECKRAKALLIGPGLGRDKEIIDFILHILKHVSIPLVIDADALYAISEKKGFFPEGSILTPHKKEALRLLGRNEAFLSDSQLHEACRNFAENHKALFILKGAPTFIFLPGKPTYISAFGDPGMATAGSGDVLTGVIAALLSCGFTRENACLFGVALHGIAGEIAKESTTSYSMIASDIIEAIPKAYQQIESSI